MSSWTGALPPRTISPECGRRGMSLRVSRSPVRVFDPHAATTTVSRASTGKVTLYRDRVKGREEDETPDREVLLRCHSQAWERRETEMIDWFQTRFEDGLRTFHDGLSTPRTRKTLTPVQQKIGQLQEANAGVAHSIPSLLHPIRRTSRRWP